MSDRNKVRQEILKEYRAWRATKEADGEIECIHCQSWIDYRAIRCNVCSEDPRK